MCNLEPIDSADEAILASQDMKTLAQWYCQLNSWKWPREIPNPEPDTYVHGGRRMQLMEWITEAIGSRAVLREWNRDMSDSEFNDFWRGTYEGHEPSRKRYEHWNRTVAASRMFGPGADRRRGWKSGQTWRKRWTGGVP